MKDLAQGSVSLYRSLTARFINNARIGLCDIAGAQDPAGIETVEEVPDVLVHRVAQQLTGRTDLHHAPALHDLDAMADTYGLSNSVGDEK